MEMCHVFWGIGSLAIQAVAAALITGLSYLVICKNRIRDLFRRKADKTEVSTLTGRVVTVEEESKEAALAAGQALAGLSAKEDKDNKVDTLDDSTEHYPSTAAVTDALAGKLDASRVTISQTDLEEGTSALADGALYFVYEEPTA